LKQAIADPRWAVNGVSGDGSGPLAHPLHPEYLVKFLWREWPVTGGDGAEHFGVELDFVKGHAVVDPKIETLSHRAHLRLRADSRNLR
jgi:hypothetical protein